MWFRSDVGGAVPRPPGLFNADTNPTQAVVSWYTDSIPCIHDGRELLQLMVMWHLGKDAKRAIRKFAILVLARLDLLGSHFSCLFPLP